MIEIPKLSEDQLDLLRQVDTPTICNAIELFDVRPRNVGYMDDRIRSCFPDLSPMVGYATTATFRSAAPPRSADVYTAMQDQVKQFESIPEPRVVVFQDLDDPPAAATFGEVMCTTYKTFGCSGLITSGAGRDLDQVRDLDFPVFTSGTICAHGYCHIIEINVPVHVGGLTIYPGDLIHGDANGVTTIPHAIADQVGRIGLGFYDAEKFVLDFLKTGSRDFDGWAEARKNYAEKIAELKAIIKR